jgi:hypothetical protein
MQGLKSICGVLLALLLGAPAVPCAAQVLNLNPTYFAQYYWDTTSSAFLPCPNTSAAEPFGSTPQAITMSGLNAGLGQWTPNVGLSSCLGGQGSGLTIVGANGPITCTGGSCDITGQSTVLQHNGTNLPSQSLLNFLDAAPSLPSGDTPVTFTTNSGGGIGGYVPPVSLGSSLAMGVTPPVSGQYAIVYPTSSSTSNCGSGLIGANNTSGFIDYNYGGSGGCPATITYTFGALPSYILAANVTAVYGFTVASSQPLVASNIASVSMVCGPVSSIIVSSNAIIPINQYTSGGSIMTGAQVSGSICTATANGSVIGAKSVNFDIKSVGLIVYYTGSAPPANTNILVEAPLYFNPSSLTLGITLPFDVGLDTGSTNALAASVAGYNLTFGQRITLAAAHNTSSITPTFALNGLSALTIVGPTGGALTSGDINTTVPAILMYGTNGSTGLWYLQNPQVSGGGGGVTSINSNAGAFTFSGSGVSCTGTTCTFSGSGSGLTSLNGLTGPALNLTSSDSSVTITPSGTSINLQAVAAAAVCNIRPARQPTPSWATRAPG